MSKNFFSDNQVGIHPDLFIALLQKLLLVYIFNVWIDLLQDRKNAVRESFAKQLPAEVLSQWAVKAKPVQSLQNLYEAVDRRGQVTGV